MQKAYIYIRIQPRDNSLKDAQEWKVNLDSPIIAELLEPLDSSIPFEGKMKEYVMEMRKPVIVGSRENLARKLADLFTLKILETFEANDTIQGYSKKEWEKFQSPKQYITPAQVHYIAIVYPEIIDKNDTEEYDKLFKLSDTSYWEVAANTINKIIEKEIKNG